jgi:elongation factor G
MDKENIKYQDVIDSLTGKLDSHAREFALPIFQGEDFKGFVDVIDKKTYRDGQVSDIEPEFKDRADEIYNELLESVAETSEELLDKFFSGEELTADEIRFGLSEAVASGDIFPILCGSAVKDAGIKHLLDAIVAYLPDPLRKAEKAGFDPKSKEEIIRAISDDEPVSGLIFKTNIDPFVGTISFFKLYSGTLKAGQEVIIAETGETIKIPQLAFPRGKNQIPAETVYAGDIACVAKVNEFVNGITFSDKRNPIIFPKIEHPSPVIYVALQPKKKQDEDRISSSLQKLNLEDTTFEIRRNPETAQLLIGGQGLTHIGYIVEKMRNMFKVEVELSDQKIVYRETIRSKGEGHGRHKKQTGGAGQFGEVFIRFEPCEEKFVFEEVIVGGAVPKNYFPAVEKGLVETFERGPLAGFPVIGVKAVLFDGSYHPVDSNEISFKMAANLAFRNALDKLRPTILEPIIQLNVMVKDEFVGDIMGDLTKRRGRVLGMEQKSGYQEIVAEVPEAEITKYAVDLKAMTQASGRFTRQFLRYEEVPEMLIGKIIEEYKKQ